MWRFVSAARMAQIKADARAEGYIKAVREGLAANDAAKDLRSVTKENTQTANTAVQEIKAEMKQGVHDMHKRVDAAQKRITYRRNQRLYRGRQRSAYTDKNIVLIYDGDAVERYLLDTMHELTLDEMVQSINKNLGTHVRGKRFPMRVTTQLLSKVINRKVYWNKELGYFIRQNGQ